MPSGIREFWVAQPFAARLGSLQGGRCSYNWFTEASTRGVATSIARPGANVTGMLLRSFELSGRRLQLLRDAAPAIARVAVLVNPRAIGPPGQRVSEDAAKLLGLAITPIEVSNAGLRPVVRCRLT
jgi:hypothetical protein